MTFLHRKKLLSSRNKTVIGDLTPSDFLLGRISHVWLYRTAFQSLQFLYFSVLYQERVDIYDRDAVADHPGILPDKQCVFIGNPEFF